jgi:hypothetical protein
MTAQPLGDGSERREGTADLHGMVLLAIIMMALTVITLFAT